MATTSQAMKQLYDTFGTEHLLPRRLECGLRSPTSTRRADLQKMLALVLDGSSEDERTALRDFFRSVWLDLILSESIDLVFDEWLEAGGLVEGTVNFYLRALAAAPLPPAATRIARFVEAHREELFCGHLNWRLWTPEYDEIVAWCEQGTPDKILMTAFDNHLGHPNAAEWEKALNTLSLLDDPIPSDWIPMRNERKSPPN